MISVIIPVYNEEETINQLYKKIKTGLRNHPNSEIIFINDGSSDSTLREIKKLPKVIFINHSRKLGQTAAIISGLKKSKGEIIITLDGDLQNDPREIPLLIKKLNQGFDMVVGWRIKRNDSFDKKILSRLAFLWRKILFRSSIHDSGCGFKAIKKKAIPKNLPKGEIHRFLPEIFLASNLKVAELPVTHQPRKKGKSKYGFKRVIRGFWDSIVIRFQR